METPTSIQEQIQRLIAFRQEIYSKVFVQRRDALMDTLDALLSTGSFPSFAMLSQSERFQRQWPSLYDAVEEGRINEDALRTLLVRQLPQQGICVFPLDGSSWPRPRAQVLEDRQYVYQASSAVNGGTVTIGYPYSWLDWCAEPHSSWALPIDVRRIPSHQTAQEVGAEQVRELARLRADTPHGLDIVAADGKYGNARFLRQVHGLPIGVVTRLRKDRVLYRPAPPASGPRRGRPRKHGAPFRFRDPTTWGSPDKVLELEDEQHGRVRLERWNGLHERRAPDLVYDVVRASIHQERSDPGSDLVVLATAGVSSTRHSGHRRDHLEGLRQPVAGRAGHPILQRGPELDAPAISAGRERGSLDMPGDPGALGALPGSSVEDTPLPWQKFQARLTPQRVRQSLSPIFVLIGSPAQTPKPRGKPPGWPKGRPRTPQPRYPVVKKGLSAAKSAAQTI